MKEIPKIFVGNMLSNSPKRSFASGRSSFVATRIRDFETKTFAKDPNSPFNTSKAVFQFSSDKSTRKARQAVRAMCLRKRMPSPAPSCAPSIMPGMSARIISLS